ncbi:MAG: IS110 family transposase [Anaerolineae bacterium]|nr:IS110 family transposase [Anaerolineae bacterium]
MQVVYTHCAGLDVHKKTVVACRSRPRNGGGVEQEVKTFGTTTPDLLELVEWLRDWGCTHVAMESTGDYWKPIYNLPEGEFEVLLTNAQHVKYVPGRKTDLGDAEWLTELLRHGLLKGSFIPPKAQRDLRDLTRYQTKLVQERVRQVNRVQKLLEGANIKLASVVSDIFGVSGRAMLEELIAGQTDPAVMAELAKGRLRKKIGVLEKALTGQVEAHHRFMLAQLLSHIDYLDEKLVLLEKRIDQHLETMGEQALPAMEQAQELTELLIERALTWPLDQSLPAILAVALLTTIPGVDWKIAVIIVAELGPDMSHFPTAKHAAAWSGLAPGNQQSAGKRYSGKTKPGNQALKSTLSQAAWAASRTKDTYLSAQYRQLVGRRGKKRAIIAVAHSIIISAYHMLSHHEVYRDLGDNYFDERKKVAVVNRLSRRLSKLGYAVRLEPLVEETSG